MNKKEKEEKLMKIWEELIKDNKNTLTAWANHPKSFISWSLRQVNETNELSVKNKDFPHIVLPYNLCYKDSKDEKYVKPKIRKRGRKKNG